VAQSLKEMTGCGAEKFNIDGERFRIIMVIETVAQYPIN